MKPSPQPVAPANRLAAWSIPRDIIIAPSRAFAAIATRPAWLPAYAVIFACGLLSTTLIAPAFAHLATTLAHPGAVERSASQRAAVDRAMLVQIALQQSVIVPLVMIGLTATTLTVIARLKKQTTPYAVYFALMANCLVPSALGTLVSALGVRFHDPAGFHDWRAFTIAVPDNLALFANPKNEREILFLGQFDIFSLWSYILLAYGILTLSGLRLTTALGIAFGLNVCLALLFWI